MESMGWRSLRIPTRQQLCPMVCHLWWAYAWLEQRHQFARILRERNANRLHRWSIKQAFLYLLQNAILRTRCWNCWCFISVDTPPALFFPHGNWGLRLLHNDRAKDNVWHNNSHICQDFHVVRRNPKTNPLNIFKRMHVFDQITLKRVI